MTLWTIFYPEVQYGILLHKKCCHKAYCIHAKLLILCNVIVCILQFIIWDNMSNGTFLFCEVLCNSICYNHLCLSYILYELKSLGHCVKSHYLNIFLFIFFIHFFHFWKSQWSNGEYRKHNYIWNLCYLVFWVTVKCLLYSLQTCLQIHMDLNNNLNTIEMVIYFCIYLANRN